MMGPRRQVGRARDRVLADLRTDRRLRRLLLLSALLCGFWLWYRAPNFATRDEQSRLLDALLVYGELVDDPSPAGLVEGVTWSRVPFGATLYLFGLAVLPVVLVTLLAGRPGIVTEFTRPVSPEFGFYPVWDAVPAWFWTACLGLVRLVNVALAVGCVYLTYRIGTDLDDRATGHLAALVLTLTFGFLTVAHEGGEDIPALFCLLVAVALLVRYVQNGGRGRFLAASCAGGAAIAFKLTAAPVVGLVLLAHLLRVANAGPADRRGRIRALLAPRLVVPGALLGVVVIVVGFPTLLVGGVDAVSARLLGDPVARAMQATGPDAPVWWWFLRGYLSGLGLPLVLAATAALVAGLARLRRGPPLDGTLVVLGGIAAYVGLLSLWHDFRVHHLLPTFPLLAVVVARGFRRGRARRPGLVRPVLAALLVTTGLYAAVGVGGYAAMPRDGATAWLDEQMEGNDTVEVYRRDVQDSAVPHGVRVQHVYGPDFRGDLVRCPAYVHVGYRDLLYLKPGTYFRGGEDRRVYVRRLLNGSYGYELAAEFSTRPPDFVPRRPEPGSVTDLLRHGIVPSTDQYADEQELAGNQYTAILRATDACSKPLDPPF